ncbi:MAG: cation-translocating P-type ATPase [Clostridia bacterium]|nr:cation-translocating P-type ATPase [Clostridia bacterium]
MEEKKSCCCHDKDKERNLNSGNNELDNECCKEKEAHSCCSRNIEVEDKCCCEKEEDKDCCGIENKPESHSCCHSHNETKSTEHSCCSAYHEHSDLNCCGIEKKGSAGCSCCGTEKKTSGDAKRDNIINIVKLVVSLAFLIAGYFNWHAISMKAPWTIAFHYVNPAWVTLIICGIPILVGAVKSLARKKITASVLISVAMLSAVILEIVGFFYNIDAGGHSHSYVFVAGEVAFLMAIGGAIEDFTVKKSRAGIERLVGLIPKEAFVKVENGLEKRPLEQINIGDIVVIKAGEQISVDGEIVNGKASVDQSSVTGEYALAELGEGDKVYGGTFNKSGVIEVKVTKLLADMTITKMAKLVEEAEGKKAPISRVADKWASIIVPTAIGLAILVGIIAYFAFKVSVIEAIIRTITVLIVFCPCSLALATPTAIAAGLGNSAKNGVLVKSGASLEIVSKCDVVCFDKTGTLTKGEIVVSDIAMDNIEQKELLRLAGSLELMSEHPLATAVVNKASGMTFAEVSSFETIQGIGVKGLVDGKVVQVISYAEAIKQNLANENLSATANEYLEQGKTVVSVIIDNVEKGIISFADSIREDATEVIAALNRMGKKTIMLTGDNEKSARFVAEKCGISEVRFGLLPEQKLQEIEQMQKEGMKVCMIGDGINDAPSLKLADCSIAMGALGSDIAIETADMAILNSDMNKIVYCVKHSKRTLFTIKRNIVLAMTVNFISIILSLFGIFDPMTGAIMHNVTSVAVVLSSALLLINRKNKELVKEE